MLDQPSLVLARTATPPGAATPDVVEALYCAAHDARHWPEALSQLAAHTGAEAAALVRYDLARGLGSVVESVGRMRASTAFAENAHFRRVAEQVLRCPSPGERSSGGADAFPIQVFAEGGQTHLVLPHPALCDAGRAAWIDVILPAEQASQRDRAIRRLEALRGHLLRALDISLELSGARHAGPSTATLLSALPTAALILGTGARVVQANSAARAILREADGVTETSDRRLRASFAREDQRLAPAIQASLAASRREQTAGHRQVVRVRRPATSATLLIILDPVALSDRPAFPDETGDAVLVRLVDEEHGLDDRTYPLQAAFDLTAAETRIAAAIASGRSTALAARQLNVSTNTVRTHLSRIFDKTGTRSQHALVRLLAGIGSWPVT